MTRPLSYEDVCDAGYDGPSPFESARLARRRRANEMLDDRDPDYIQPPEDDEEEEEEDEY